MRCGALPRNEAEPTAVIPHEIKQHVHLRVGKPATARIDVAEEHHIELAQLLG